MPRHHSTTGSPGKPTGYIQKAPPGCLVGGGCLGLAGAAVAGFFGLAFMGGLMDKNQGNLTLLLICPALAIGGGVMIWAGFRKWGTVKLHRRLIDLIAHQGHFTVEKIALLLNESDHDLVVRSIQAVIDRGYLPGYSLDPLTGNLHFFAPDRPPTPREPRRVAFKCLSCGAANEYVTIDIQLRCQFCGTPQVE